MKVHTTEIFLFLVLPIVVLSGDVADCSTAPDWEWADAQYFCNIESRQLSLEWILIISGNTQNTIATCDTSEKYCTNRDPCFKASVSGDGISELRVPRTYSDSHRVSVECHEIKENQELGKLAVQNYIATRKTSTPFVLLSTSLSKEHTEIQSSLAELIPSSDSKTLTTASEKTSNFHFPISTPLDDVRNSKPRSQMAPQTTESNAMQNHDDNSSSSTTKHAVSRDVTHLVTSQKMVLDTSIVSDHIQTDLDSSSSTFLSTAEEFTTTSTHQGSGLNAESLAIGATVGCVVTLCLICMILLLYRWKYSPSIHPSSLKAESCKPPGDLDDAYSSEGYASRRSSSKSTCTSWDDPNCPRDHLNCPGDLPRDSPCYLATEVVSDGLCGEDADLIDNPVYNSSGCTLTEGIV